MSYKQWTFEIERETVRLMSEGDWTPFENDIQIDKVEKRVKRRFVQKPEKIGGQALKRVMNLRQCLSQIRAKVCECGEAVPGTGRIEPLNMPCNSRVCPACNRRRSAKLMDWGKKIFESVAKLPQASNRKQNRYRLITLTRQYNPWDWKDVSIKGIRRRTKEYKEIWANVWQWLQVQSGKNQGAYRAIEIAGTGHVHCHILHWGPWIDLPLLIDFLKFVHPGTGVHVDGTNQKGLSGKAAELFKYAVKGPGMSNLDWLAGKKCEAINPALAARVLIAWTGERTAERYGVFRDVPKPENCDKCTESDNCQCSKCTELKRLDLIPCPHCGSIERSRNTFSCRIDEWIAHCSKWDTPPLVSQILAIERKQKAQREEQRQWIQKIKQMIHNRRQTRRLKIRNLKNAVRNPDRKIFRKRAPSLYLVSAPTR